MKTKVFRKAWREKNFNMLKKCLLKNKGCLPPAFFNQWYKNNVDSDEIALRCLAVYDFLGLVKANYSKGDYVTTSNNSFHTWTWLLREDFPNKNCSAWFHYADAWEGFEPHDYFHGGGVSGGHSILELRLLFPEEISKLEPEPIVEEYLDFEHSLILEKFNEIFNKYHYLAERRRYYRIAYRRDTGEFYKETDYVLEELDQDVYVLTYEIPRIIKDMTRCGISFSKPNKNNIVTIKLYREVLCLVDLANKPLGISVDKFLVNKAIETISKKY